MLTSVIGSSLLEYCNVVPGVVDNGDDMDSCCISEAFSRASMMNREPRDSGRVVGITY